MEKEKFPGNLQSISPRTLLGPTSSTIDDFFLVLALIYNDLKTITFLGVVRDTKYEVPAPKEISAHAGEHYGLIVFQYKVQASLINEFLIFLKKNGSVLQSSKFLLVLSRLSAENKTMWKELEKLALEGKDPPSTSYLSTLARIRNNIGFHYDHSMRELKSSFLNFFEKRKDSPGSERAYYSLEDTMSHSRFYYADAAASEYISMRAKEMGVSQEEMLPNHFNDYANKLNETSGNMNRTLLMLLTAYLDLKKKGKV